MLFSVDNHSISHDLNLGQKYSAYLHSWDTVKSVTKFGLLLSFLASEGMWSHRKCPEFESWLYLPLALCGIREVS